jgi:hypothetical protein
VNARRHRGRSGQQQGQDEYSNTPRFFHGVLLLVAGAGAGQSAAR